MRECPANGQNSVCSGHSYLCPLHTHVGVDGPITLWDSAGKTPNDQLVEYADCSVHLGDMGLQRYEKVIAYGHVRTTQHIQPSP